MTVERTPSYWGFWLRWVLATTCGVALGFQLIANLGYALIVLFVPICAIMGFAVGILQWLAAQRTFAFTLRWVLATGLALTAGGVLSVALLLTGSFLAMYPSLHEPVSSFALTQTLFAPLGLVVGAGQWLILRRKSSKAGWWVLASTLAFVLFAAIVEAGVDTEVDIAPGGHLAIGIIGGLAVGAVTGGALVWLMRSVNRKTSQS
jgi:hypothetical protein